LFGIQQDSKRFGVTLLLSRLTLLCSHTMSDGNEPQVSLTREDIAALVQAVAKELAPRLERFVPG